MVRALFEALESSLGPHVADAGLLVFRLALAVLAWAVVAPLLRAALQGRLASAGLSMGWTVACDRCRGRTRLSGNCEQCGAPVQLPAGTRWLARLSAPGTPSRGAWRRWGPAVLGTSGFAAATVLLATNSHLFSPQGRVERLLAAATLLAWAAVAFQVGRLFSLQGLRLGERLKAVPLAAIALGLVLAGVSVSQAARPEALRRVTVLVATQDSVQVDGQSLAAPGGAVGVEYQLVEVQGLGVVHLTPLAVSAQGRVPLRQDRVEAAVLDGLWEHASALKPYGVTVRRLTEQFQLAPGTRAQLVAKERELAVEPAP